MDTVHLELANGLTVIQTVTRRTVGRVSSGGGGDQAETAQHHHWRIGKLWLGISQAAETHGMKDRRLM